MVTALEAIEAAIEALFAAIVFHFHFKYKSLVSCPEPFII
jgi:hypothetical protein